MSFNWRLVAVMLLLQALLAAAPAGGAITFDDPYSPQQWYLQRMNFGDAWATIHALPQRGQVTVAVVDSGFDLGHGDLGSVRNGINIVDGSQNLSPVHPHGTATMGAPGAASGNALGISQAAWTSDLMPIRVTNRSDGAAYTSDIIKGIRYAADRGARVINISYSGVHLQALEDAAKYAQQRGAVVIMAAGNDGRWMWGWKNHKRLLSVGSIGQDGKLSNFSSRGKFVDLVAPGEQFTTLNPNDSYGNWSGTSFSAPLVASLASLMFTANPDLAPWQVRNLLKRSAEDLGKTGRDGFYGWGLPDAERAVDLALNTDGYYAGSGINFATRVFNDTSDWDPGLLASNSAGSGKLLNVQGFVEVVPEPGSAAVLMAMGMMCLWRGRRG